MLPDQLKDIVGPGGWIDDPQDLEPHLQEWRGTWHGRTPLLVAPDSTADVAAVVAACAAAQVGIVPQGGNTGLCGGAIPDASGTQVLLSLSRLKRIRTVDAEGYTLTAEAGCTLAAIQEAAAVRGRFFPLSLAAEGSCQIGGNLSTDAGGINVLRYGTARAQALGLEVVLADGTVWNGLRTLRKDTAGYDLKQLFIGAEGTLGIITAASLRLYPVVRNPETVLFALPSADAAVTLLAALRDALADSIQAFELIPDQAVQFVRRHIPAAAFPLEGHPWFALLETARAGSTAEFEAVLAGLLERGLVADAVVAKNRSEAQRLWRFRHAVSEAQKREGASLKHDVSVPVAKVGEFIRTAESAVKAAYPGVRVVAFGHVGDGNIHFNLSQPPGDDADDFRAAGERLAVLVYDLVDSLGGSFSAEHGVGQAKRHQLEHYRGPIETGLMRAVKAALDPQSILNPGKVI